LVPCAYSCFTVLVSQGNGGLLGDLLENVKRDLAVTIQRE
jgi:hypothetical protein